MPTKTREIDVSLILEGFVLNSDGTLTNKRSGRNTNSLKPSHEGYVRFFYRKKMYNLHRVIWAIHNGDPGHLEVDHINGIRHDNRIENLRAVTHLINNQNQAVAQRNSSTGIYGVSKTKSGNYVVRIRHNGKRLYVGTYGCSAEAKAAYLRKKKELHDGYVEHRFPESLNDSQKSLRSHNKTGIPGTHLRKSDGKYGAEYKGRYLGIHQTLDQATQAVLSAKQSCKENER